MNYNKVFLRPHHGDLASIDLRKVFFHTVYKEFLNEESFSETYFSHSNSHSFDFWTYDWSYI